MGSLIESAYAGLAVILWAEAATAPVGSSLENAASPNNGSIAGKWHGSFTPTSRMGVLQARVNLNRDKTAEGIDVTGLWKGSFDKIGPSGRVTPAPFSLNIKQNGTRLSGMAGPDPQEQVAISNGRIEGGQITFEAPHPPSGPNIRFELTLTNGHLRGIARMEERPEQVPSRPLRAVLVQRGDDISGQIGFQEDQRFAITKGRREKDQLFLQTDSEGLLINYVLNVTAGQLEGEAKMEHDGHLITAKVALKPEN